MKKSQIFKKLALVTATLAFTAAFAACGSSTSSSGTTTDTTTGDVPLSGDATATGDTAATCDNYVKPTTNPGCTAADDKTWVALADGTTVISDNFGDIVSDCTLKQGCLAMGGETCTADEQATSKAICITACIVKECGAVADTDPTSAKCSKISNNCAWCYGRYSGECGFEKCLSDCAVDSSSAACRSCLAANCDTVRDACKTGN